MRTQVTRSPTIVKRMNNYGKISREDMRKMYINMEKKRLITEYNLPKKPSSDGYYHLWIKTEGGRKQLKAKTIDELIDKLFTQTRKTFKQVFELAQADKLKYIKSEEKLLSARNTLLHTQSEYNRFISGTDIESYAIDLIEKRDVENIILLNLQRYDLTKKGLASLKSVLAKTFRYAYEEYMIMDNVIERINWNKYKDLLIQPVDASQRAHSDEDVQRILDVIHAKQESDPLYIPAWALELQIYAGMRRGEVPPLEWSDFHDGYIEISKEQITVKEKPQRFVVVNHTKTWKDRRFPITPEVENILERMPKLSDRYLFPSGDGVINNNVVPNYYKRICDKLGIERSRDAMKGTHSFRRNGITRVINQSGGNILMASKLYGNTPQVADSNYYTGLDLDMARSILCGNQAVTNSKI